MPILIDVLAGYNQGSYNLWLFAVAFAVDTHYSIAKTTKAKYAKSLGKYSIKKNRDLHVLYIAISANRLYTSQ